MAPSLIYIQACKQIVSKYLAILYFNFSSEPSSIFFRLHYLLFTIRGPYSGKPGCLDLTKNLTCFAKLARTVMSSNKE